MTLIWEHIESKDKDGDKLWTNWGQVWRAKVPGGWLVYFKPHGEGGGLIFYPDPNHTWDGNSPQ